jgi:hypothetical protein
MWNDRLRADSPTASGSRCSSTPASLRTVPGVGLPTGAATLYRGCLPARVRGMAWTTTVERAEFFAERRGASARVYAAHVPPRHILAILHDRGEDEVVVNPRWLSGGASPSLVS